MILAIDIGTTSVKAGVFDRAGRCVSRASAPVRPDASSDPLAQEIDPSLWIDCVARLATELDAARVRPRCVVVSGNGPTLLPADARGKPLHDAITWLDRRSVEESEIVSKAAGFYLDPTFYLPKALWFMRHKRGIYDRTVSFFSCPEFVDAFLTGVRCAFLPAEGFRRFIWTEDSIRAVGMDPDKFPPFVRTGEIVGAVTPEASARTGIPAGTPVVAGAPDFVVSILGTAATRPGRVCDRAGTSEGINYCSLTDLHDSRLLNIPHIIEPLFNMSAPISTSGKAVEWFKDLSGRSGIDYESLFEEVCQASPGSGKLLFLPYLCGERAPIWDSYARGVFLGMTLNHGRVEMTRAVVESTGFAIRDVIDVLESDGAEVSELRATGNPSKSPVWNQIKADITGKPLSVPEMEEAELMGDACIGMKAMGDFSTLQEAAEALVRMKKTYEPNRALAEMYGDLFAVYRSTYASLKQVFRDLDRIAT